MSEDSLSSPLRCLINGEKLVFWSFWHFLSIFNILCDSQYSPSVFRYFLGLRASEELHLCLFQVWHICFWWVTCLLIIFDLFGQFSMFFMILNILTVCLDTSCASEPCKCFICPVPMSDWSALGEYLVNQLFFDVFQSIFQCFLWFSMSFACI